MPNAEPKTVHAPSQDIQAKSPHDVRPSAGGMDLNSATEEQIAEIDMIGKKLAHAIVERRATAGQFSSWDELRSVPGLDAMKIAELQRAARIGDTRS
jgi:DNA uptake protein ComE-like DNA-binding protein